MTQIRSSEKAQGENIKTGQAELKIRQSANTISVLNITWADAKMLKK